MMVLLAKLLRKAGRLELSAAVLRAAGRLRPRSTAVLREYCINRMSARDFAAVQARCARVAALTSPGRELQDLAAFWLVRSDLEDSPPESSLQRLQNSYRSAAAQSLRHFAQDRREEARTAFQQAVQLAGIPEQAQAEWTAAFAALTGDPGQAHPGPAAELSRRVSKIAVSGMYWSGSGAIFDFLREFEQLAPVHGELRLWKEGDFCLHALQKHLGRPEEFRYQLLRFLQIALLGISPVHNWQEQMAVDYALEAARGDTRGEYAALGRSFIQQAVAAGGEGAGDAFVAAAGSLTDGLARLWSGGGETVLFDNIVHIGAIDAVGLLGENVKVLCSFRDPRSTFAARWYENPRFNRDVERFIAYYRRTVENFDRSIAASPELAQKVVRVSFEQFILSEQYRERLAADCGLDTSRRRKGTLFQPESSRKNVQNYLNFPHQDMIKKIECELAEYCYDVSAGEVNG